MNNFIKRKKNIRIALWSRNYIVLILVNIFSAFSFNMVSTVLSKYLVNLGTPLALAGIIVGIFSITALFIRPVSGMTSDRYNKRNILIISNMIIGISVLGYTLSNVVAVIFAFRILHGIAFGMSGTASIALASEVIPKERTGEGIGYVGMGQILAVAVAPGLGIMITERFGYNASFVTAFIFGIAASLLLIFFKNNKPEKAAIPRTFQKVSIKNLIAGETLIFSIISGVMSLNNGIVNAYILLFSDQLHIRNISVYFMVTAVFMFIVRPVSGRIMDRKGLLILVYPAFAIGILAMFLHGLSTTLWLLLPAAALKAIASASIQSSLLVESIKRAGSDRSGVATSTYYIGADIGQGIGPVIGGFIANSYGYSAMFYFCAVATIMGGVLFFINNLKESTKHGSNK